MKQLQRLFATLLLVCALALNAAAGIIQTGTPPPPPPESTTQTEDEMAAETAEGETTVLEEAAAVALDFMCDLLTIF